MQYDSPVGKLAAYLSPDPNDGKRHPAIIWITGGDRNTIGEFDDTCTKRRAEAFGSGALDGIPGIGPAKKRMLLQRFGSVSGLREVPFEDLPAVPGIGERLARAIRERVSA